MSDRTLIAVLILLMAVMALLAVALVSNSWEVDSIAHGYAHYSKDHTWHWNDEGVNLSINQ